MHIFKGQILITLLGLNQSNLPLLKLMVLWFNAELKSDFLPLIVYCVLQIIVNTKDLFVCFFSIEKSPDDEYHTENLQDLVVKLMSGQEAVEVASW